MDKLTTTRLTSSGYWDIGILGALNHDSRKSQCSFALYCSAFGGPDCLLEILHTLFLALIQGITEFLPISSSAHLILPFQVFGWPDQGLAFDVAVHTGSLIAVIWFFRADIAEIADGAIKAASENRHNQYSRLGLAIVLASLPIIPLGYATRDFVELNLRSLPVIATATMLFGIVLWISDYLQKTGNDEFTLGWADILIIGLAQCISLIPGTSRSGITIAAGLLVGLSRRAAARFSFLLAIPAIAGATCLTLFDLLQGPDDVDWFRIALGGLISALSSYLCIKWFLALIERLGFLPFVLYRLLLGTMLWAFVLAP